MNSLKYPTIEHLEQVLYTSLYAVKNPQLVASVIYWDKAICMVILYNVCKENTTRLVCWNVSVELLYCRFRESLDTFAGSQWHLLVHSAPAVDLNIQCVQVAATSFATPADRVNHSYTWKEDYEHFGMSLSSYPHGGLVTAIEDTGCQSCLIGLKMVYRLAFKQADLPMTHKMSAVNRQAIKISGTVILCLWGADRGGYPVESTQLCYVSPESEKWFLSHETSIDLGFISSSFLILGEALQVNPDTASSASNSKDTTTSRLDECTCLERSLPPPFQGPSNAKGALLLGPSAAAALRWIKAAHCWGDPTRSEDIWKTCLATLVKRWHWVLPTAETLHLTWQCIILLPT